MRGRSCTQPFLVEKSAYRPDAFLLPPRWVSRLPPHPPQCAHWGTFPPRGRLWGETQRGGNVLSQKCFFSIFFPENASQIGLRISEEIVPRTDQSQPSPNPASGNERLSKPGVQGACPGPLSPHFSGEMGTPAGQAGPRGAAPRGFETAPTTRRVRTTEDLAPGPTSGAAGRRSNPAKKEPPLWSATRGRIPRRRATLSSCFLYVCPGKAGRLALCGGRGLTPAPA